MKLLIQIAGRIIEINMLYEATSLYLREYIVNSDSAKPDITVDITFDDLIAEQKRTQLGSKLLTNSKEYVYFDRDYHEFLAIHHKIADRMPFFNTILMHGAVVAKDNYAYMFVASSGIGKSTRARMWINEYPDSIIVNGDKPLIIINEDNSLTCGTPWCGKEGWNTNIMVPLRAIYLLERTENGKRSSINEMDLDEAFIALLRHTYRPNNPIAMQKSLQLLQKLVEKTKVYQFRSDLSKDAIHLAYETALQ